MTEILTFGTWLRQQRRQRDLTQSEFADQVGCATVTIKKIESGERRPSRQMASRLAECLDFPTDDWDVFIQAARAGHTPILQPLKPGGMPEVRLPALRSAFFARLGVFAGGFSAEAADALGTSHTLPCLVSANLVQQVGKDRYTLLQTLRDYALECLETSDECGASHHEHARYFCQLAGEASDLHYTAAISAWQRRLAVDRSNIRAALAWCLEHDPELGLELAANMWKLWYLWGQYRSGAQWLGQFLEYDERPTLTRSRALRGRAILISRYGEFERARPLFEESLNIAQQRQDGYGVASALMGLGDSFNALGQHREALTYYQQSLKHFESQADPRGRSWALGGLADVAYKKDNDLPRAIELMAECVRLARQADDPRHLAWMLSIAADLDAIAEHPEQSQRRVAEAHDLFTQVGDLPGISYANLRLGALAFHSQKFDLAQIRLEKALDLAHDTYTISYEAQALSLLGIIALQKGRYEHGIQYCALAFARHRFLRKRLLRADIALLDQLLDTARSALGSSGFNEIWQKSYRESSERQSVQLASDLLRTH